MFGDIYNVKNRIKALDKNLDMSYKGNGQYEITHNGKHFMTVTKEELDDRTVKKVREIIYKNVNADILEEIEKENKKVEERNQKHLDNNIEAMAKEIKPYVRRLD